MKADSSEKSILIMSFGFSIGGVLSAFRQLAKLFAANGYNIDVLTCGELSKEIKAQFGNNVNFFCLPRLSKLIKVKAYIVSGVIRDKLKQKTTYNKVANSVIIQRCDSYLADQMPAWNKYYDVAIAASEFFSTYYVAKKCHARRKIAWIHPRWDLLNAEARFEDKYYNEFDRIITVSHDCCIAMQNAFPHFASKIITIENIVNADEIIRKANCSSGYKWEGGKRRFVTVCRLDNKSKRIDRIVLAAQRLKEIRNDFQFVIVGDGPDNRTLRRLVKRTGTDRVITFVGKRDNPYPFIKEADIFVLSSQYEGLPIVVSEALILGKQLLLTDCINWKDEIRSHAIVVSNNDKTVILELARALSILIDNYHKYPLSKEQDISYEKTIREIIAD